MEQIYQIAYTLFKDKCPIYICYEFNDCIMKKPNLIFNYYT